MYVGDPLFDFASDRTMLVDVQAGLNRSTDDGCSWSTAIGQQGNEEVVDFTLSKAEPGRVLAVKSAAEEGSIVVRLLESNDDGRSFVATGSPLPISTAFSVELAPSDSMRVYATGLSRSNTGQLLVSNDRGRTWVSKSIPDTSFDAIPYIATVHPRDPDKIFVRIDGRIFSDVDDRYHAHDAVLYTDDGGETWSEIHRAEGKALGFALSPDGTELLLGYGSDGVFEVDEGSLGVYASSTERFTFSRLVEGSITCLSWTKTGIYVCTPQFKVGRELAFAPRLALGANGSELETLLKLPEVKGPLACCNAKVAGVCREAWPTACLLLQACADASLPVGCGDGGGGRGVDASSDSSGPAPDSGAVSISTGACSCRTGAGPTRHDNPTWCTACLCALAAVRARCANRRRAARTFHLRRLA